MVCDRSGLICGVAGYCCVCVWACIGWYAFKPSNDGAKHMRKRTDHAELTRHEMKPGSNQRTTRLHEMKPALNQRDPRNKWIQVQYMT